MVKSTPLNSGSTLDRARSRSFKPSCNCLSSHYRNPLFLLPPCDAPTKDCWCHTTLISVETHQIDIFRSVISLITDRPLPFEHFSLHTQQSTRAKNRLLRRDAAVTPVVNKAVSGVSLRSHLQFTLAFCNPTFCLHLGALRKSVYDQQT